MYKESLTARWLSVSCALSIFLLAGSSVEAQQVFGISYGYDYLPYALLADPVSEAPDMEIQMVTRSFGASFPLMFGDGKIMLLNQFNYRKTEFSYKNFPVPGTPVEQAQYYSYTAFMIYTLNEKWQLLAVGTPGFASDFEADISGEDFTFSVVLGLIRTKSDRFSWGFGLAYSRDFGEPFPFPFLYYDWNNGARLKSSGIVPVDLNLTYQLNPMIDLGLALKVGGNRYQGNPDKYGVDDPEMAYSEGTFGPNAMIHFAPWAHLRIEPGFAFFRRFEFFDGTDLVQSYDTKGISYVRMLLVLGM